MNERNDEKSLMIRLAVSTEYRRVTDGQTDKHHATALFALYIASRGKQLQFCHCFHYYVAGHLFSCTLHCQCYNCLFVCCYYYYYYYYLANHSSNGRRQGTRMQSVEWCDFK